MSYFLLTAFNSSNLVQKEMYPVLVSSAHHLVKVNSETRTRDLFSGIKTPCVADYVRCFNKPLNNLLSFTLRPD